MSEVTILGPPESNGGVGQYTSQFGEALGDTAVIRRLSVGIHPLSQLRSIVSSVRDSGSVIHVQFVYSFFGPAGISLFLILPLMWVLTRVRKKNIIFTVHEVWGDDLLTSPFRRYYCQLLHLLLWFVVDDLVFISEMAKETFEKQAPGDRYTVVSHGVITDEVREISNAKRCFGYDESDILITQHGFVNPRKGFETFIKIAENLPEYEFLIAGGPRSEDNQEYYNKIQAAAPPNVSITGVLDSEDFHAAFVASDVAVMPYEAIFQSGIFNWCAAYEVPVVATEIPYFRDISKCFGAPLLFPPRDDEIGAERIKQLITNPDLQEQVSKGLMRYTEQNDIQSVVERYRDLY